MTWLDILNTILFWAFLYVYLWNAYIFFFNKGVPNIKTAPAIRNKVIEIFSKDQQERGINPYKVADLGCGNGNFAIQMAKNIPNSHITGYEIAKLAFWRCNLLQKRTKTKNITFIQQSFLEADLSQFDALMIYQMDTIMPELREKLSQELKPGTVIICNKFYLGGDWEPTEIINVKTRMPHQKTIYVYYA